MALGADNGHVYFFDWEGALKRKVLSHDAAVTAIVSVEVGDAHFVTGGFDGKLRLWSSKFEMEGEVELCTNETVLAGAAMGQANLWSTSQSTRSCLSAS